MRNWIFLPRTCAQVWGLLGIIILAIFQVTILDYFRVFGLKPDLLLIAVVMTSLFFDWRWAIVFALVAGILKDTFAITDFGVNTLLFPLWSFFIKELSKKISIDNNFIGMALVFIVGLMHELISRLLFIFLGNAIILPIGCFLRIAFLGALWSALTSFLLFKVVK